MNYDPFRIKKKNNRKCVSFDSQSGNRFKFTRGIQVIYPFFDKKGRMVKDSSGKPAKRVIYHSYPKNYRSARWDNDKLARSIVGFAKKDNVSVSIHNTKIVINNRTFDYQSPKQVRSDAKRLRRRLPQWDYIEL